MLVVLLFAALVYGALWLIEQHRAGRAGRAGGEGGPSAPRAKPPRRSTAPDDDEDFLRGLRKHRTDDDA